MSKKKYEIDVDEPIEYCEALVLKIGNNAKGWNYDKNSSTRYRHVWKWGGLWKNPGKTIVELLPLKNGKTNIEITAENIALGDVLGVLENELSRIVDPLLERFE